MSNRIPSRSTFPGKLGQEFDRLWSAIRSLRPAPTPGLLTSQTTRGVQRRPLGHNSRGSHPIIHALCVTTLADDFVVCTSGHFPGGYDLVLRPTHLRTSQWKGNSWEPGQPFKYGWSIFMSGIENIDVRYDYIYAAGDEFDGPSARIVVWDRPTGPLPSLPAGEPFTLQHQLIYPTYGLHNPGQGVHLTSHLDVFCMRDPEELYYLAEDFVCDGVKTWPAGYQIKWQDVNWNCRQWRDTREIIGEQKAYNSAGDVSRVLQPWQQFPL